MMVYTGEWFALAVSIQLNILYTGSSRKSSHTCTCGRFQAYIANLQYVFLCLRRKKYGRRIRFKICKTRQGIELN